MTLTRRKPIRQRARKIRRRHDPERLAWIHDQACCICGRNGKVQWTPTEAAHIYNVTVDGGGAYSKRPDDWRTLPLCRYHHRGGLSSYHHLGRRFADFHGIDLERLIEEYTEKFAMETGRKVA